MVVSGSVDKTLNVWDMTSNQCLRTLQGHSDCVFCVAWLPNGNVISGLRDNTLKVWNIATSQCVKTLQGHSDSVNCVAWLPNGNVISGAYDNTLKVWDIVTGECLSTMQGHGHHVMSVAALSRGSVISGSRDNTLKVWIDHALQNEYHISIRKISRILAQGYRDKDSLFSHPVELPSDILFKIGGFTGDSQSHTEEESVQIAKHYFSKPQ